MSFTDDDGYSETLTSDATDAANRPPNATATGQPAITGTVQVGETLSAETSGISDGNGLTNAQYDYHWVRNDGSTDTDISGATGSTFTLTSSDAGYAFKVKVTFTDDEGYSESLASNLTDTLLVPQQQSSSTPEPDDGDFPDETTTSGVVNVGDSVRGKINFIGDRDWFAVALEGGRTYHVDQLGGWINHLTLLYGIYDQTGTFVDGTMDENRGGGSDSHVVFTPANDGTYFVAAGADESGDYSYFPIFIVASYRLSVIDATDGHPDDAHTADIETTGRISVDGRVDGNINYRSDRDWFAVTLESGIEYQIDILGWPTRDGSLLDPYLAGIYDSSGTVVANTANDNGGYERNSRLIYSATNSGTYFLGAGAQGNSKGTYILQVLDNTDDYPADISTTGALTVPGTIMGRIEHGGDRDWFAVPLQAEIDYAFDLDGRIGDIDDGKLDDPKLYGIYDSAGIRIDCTQDDDGGYHLNSRVLFKPDVTGTYYVSAGHEEHPLREIGTYMVSVSQDSDDYSANSCTKGALDVEGKIGGEVEEEGDHDWFAITLSEGKVYQFDLMGSSTGRGTMKDPHIHGIDDGQGGWTWSDWGAGDDGVGRDSRMIFAASRSGTHYVSAGGTDFVTSAEGDNAVKGTYELSATEKLDDHVGDTGTSGEVKVGGMGSGNIEVSGDQDWFGVFLKAGRTYEFVLKGSWDAHGTLDDPYLLGIHNAQGSIIADTSNDDTDHGPDSRVEFSVQQTGTYYVAVGADGSGIGTYKLWVGDYTGW